MDNFMNFDQWVDTLQGAAGHAGHAAFSPYMATVPLSIGAAGWISRKYSGWAAEYAMETSDELTRMQLEFNKWRTDAEIAMLTEEYQHSKDSEYDQCAKKADDDLRKESFQYFLKTVWNERYTVQPDTVFALRDTRKNQKVEDMKLRLIVANTLVLSPEYNVSIYSQLCDELEELLQGYFEMQWIQINPKIISRSTMADALNVHYLLQGIPTLMLFVRRRGGNLVVECAMWTFMQGHGGIMVRPVLSAPAPADGGLDGVLEQTRQMLFGVAAVAGDTFGMLHCGRKPELYYKLSERVSDPALLELVRKCYRDEAASLQCLRDRQLPEGSDLDKWLNEISK